MSFVDHSPDRTAPPPDLTAQPLRFLSAYWNVWRTLASQAEDVLSARHDLDLRSFIALSYIQGGVSTPGELARAMAVPRYEISRTLDRLSRAGAITRTTDPANARRRTLRASPRGHQLWSDALNSVTTLTGPILGALGPALEPLTSDLERLALLARGDS